MSTKSKKRRAKRQFLKQANEICVSVDEEILCVIVHYASSEPRYVGRIQIRALDEIKVKT